MKQTLTKLNDEKKQVVHMGDYNLDLLNHNTHSLTEEFLELNFSNYMLPTCTKPTRIFNESATLIDNIYTNIDHQGSIMKGIIISDISDHFPIIYSYETSKNRAKQDDKLLIRSYSEKNYASFAENISKIYWEFILSIDTSN